MDASENDTFAEKLDHLFNEKTKSDGTFYTPAEILEVTTGVLTRVHLWKLRTGKATNPSLRVINILADAFGVPPSYFFDSGQPTSDADVGNQREELRVVLRSFGLDKDEQKAVLLMVETLKKSKK